MRKIILRYLLFIFLLLFLACNQDDDIQSAPNLIEVLDGHSQLSDDEELAIQEYMGKKTQWLMMFYLGGDNNLEEFLLADIEEIFLANYDPETIKIIILIDRSFVPIENKLLGQQSGGQAYLLWSQEESKKLSPIAIPELDLAINQASEINSGQAETLAAFLSYGKKMPADYYALFLGSHGTSWWHESPNLLSPKLASWQAWANTEINSIIAINNNLSATLNEQRLAVVYDDSSRDGSLKAAIEIDALAAVLEQNPLQILGFDACSMGAIEVAYSLRHGVDYMLASMDLEPAAGWNYRSVLEAFSQGGSPEQFARTIVDAYAKDYYDWDSPEVTSITMSMIDLKAFAMPEFSRFFFDKNDYIDTLPDHSFYQYESKVPWLKDFFFRGKPVLIDLSVLFLPEVGLSAQEKQDLTTFIETLVPYNHASKISYPDLVGLAISVPPQLDSYVENYQRTRFAQDTFWGDYMRQIAK